MNLELSRKVRNRANQRCEYCLLPSKYSLTEFEIDHIIAEQHGGLTRINNLALACFACNHHKGPNLAGIDPITRKRCWLFNPRRQKWNVHFHWEGALLIGKTPVGRATVEVLAINLSHRVQERLSLMEERVF